MTFLFFIRYYSFVLGSYRFDIFDSVLYKLVINEASDLLANWNCLVPQLSDKIISNGKFTSLRIFKD